MRSPSSRGTCDGNRGRQHEQAGHAMPCSPRIRNFQVLGVKMRCRAAGQHASRRGHAGGFSFTDRRVESTASCRSRMYPCSSPKQAARALAQRTRIGNVGGLTCGEWTMGGQQERRGGGGLRKCKDAREGGGIGQAKGGFNRWLPETIKRSNSKLRGGRETARALRARGIDGWVSRPWPWPWTMSMKS